MSDSPFLGVDLGGTNIQTAAVRDGDVLASAKAKTRSAEGFEAVLDRIEATVRDVMAELDATAADFGALCIGAPGAVDRRAGIVRDAPNLGWTDAPLGEALSARLGLRVFVDNDVNVGVVGEHTHGAGRGSAHMVGIFVGTGIGGGLIVAEEPHYGARGAAGEIGHMVLDPGGRRCRCGRQGCAEAYASKTAMEAMLRERLEEGEETIVFELMARSGKRRLTSGVIDAALQAGDEAMRDVLDTARFYLGLLAANLANGLDPDVIVFGGGVVERLGASFVDPVAGIARGHILVQAEARPLRIVPATLGDHAGTIGAAVVAERSLRGSAGTG